MSVYECTWYWWGFFRSACFPSEFNIKWQHLFKICVKIINLRVSVREGIPNPWGTKLDLRWKSVFIVYNSVGLYYNYYDCESD